MALHLLYDEQGVLEGVASGSASAFRQLYDYYRPYIYTWVLRVSKSEVLAEEAVQDLFLKLWNHKEHLPQISNFSGYLHQMARNYSYDALRLRAKEKLVLHIMSESETGESSDQPLLSKEVRAKIRLLIDQLPGKQKEVFILSRQEGLSHLEISKRLNISLHAVQKNMVRALGTLRKDISAEYGEYGLALIVIHGLMY